MNWELRVGSCELEWRFNIPISNSNSKLELTMAVVEVRYRATRISRAPPDGFLTLAQSARLIARGSKIHRARESALVRPQPSPPATLRAIRSISPFAEQLREEAHGSIRIIAALRLRGEETG